MIIIYYFMNFYSLIAKYNNLQLIFSLSYNPTKKENIFQFLLSLIGSQKNLYIIKNIQNTNLYHTNTFNKLYLLQYQPRRNLYCMKAGKTTTIINYVNSFYNLQQHIILIGVQGTLSNIHSNNILYKYKSRSNKLCNYNYCKIYLYDIKQEQQLLQIIIHQLKNNTDLTTIILDEVQFIDIQFIKNIIILALCNLI